MNAGQFVTRMARIENEPRRSRQYKRRALKALMREAGAERIFNGDKLTGWRLPNGQTVCSKWRYRSEDAAASALATIQANPLTERIPQRYYPCPFCRGWHLTSQHRTADNDN